MRGAENSNKPVPFAIRKIVTQVSSINGDRFTIWEHSHIFPDHLRKLRRDQQERRIVLTSSSRKLGQPCALDSCEEKINEMNLKEFGLLEQIPQMFFQQEQQKVASH
jgi:hypothetical protein